MKIEKYLTETAKALLKAKDGKKPLFYDIDENNVFIANNNYMGIVIPKSYNIFNEDIKTTKMFNPSGDETKKTGKMFVKNKMVFWEMDNGLGINDKFLKYFDDDATFLCAGSLFKVFEHGVFVGIIAGAKNTK